MRALFAPGGGAGHLLPVMAVAHELHTAGADVRFVVPEFAARPVREAGFDAAGLPPSEPFQVAAQRRGLDFSALSHAERDDLMFETVVMGSHLEARLTCMLEYAREWSPDMVVWGDGNFVAQLAAEILGLPHVAVQVFATGRIVSCFPRMRERLAARIESMRDALGLGADPELASPYRYALLSQYPPSLLFPEEASLRTRIAMQRTNSGADAPDRGPRWLADSASGDTQPGVYVTLGTLMPVEESLPILHAVLDGLADEPLQVIATTGPMVDPADLQPLPQNARVERYVAQELILPDTDLVIFHGGSGTLIGALEYGIPMLAVPVRADQPQNARAVEAAGAGRSVPQKCVTAAAMRDSVRDLLENPSYRANARRLQAELEALPPMRDVIRLLGRLVHA